MSNNIMIENARIGFRNFAGKEGNYNPEGRRNFCVFLETELANRLVTDGWNIRWLDPKDNNEDRQAYMQVAIRFDNDRPPKVVLVSSRGKTILTEETIISLDFAEISMVDLTINPSRWNDNGKSRIKAYLRSMYVTIVEDQLESKYYDTPDSAESSIGGCGNCEECTGDCKCHAD